MDGPATRREGLGLVGAKATPGLWACRLLIALFVGTTPALAQGRAEPVPSPVLTLDQALELAGSAAPSREAAAAGVRASDAARTVAGLLPNPQLQSEIENVAGSGAYKGRANAETTVGLALPVELGGKRAARIAVADAEADRARVEAAMADADLRQRVTQTYAVAIGAERRATMAREQMTVAEEALRAAGVRVKAGRASPLEAQRADVLRANAAAAVESAERSAQLGRASLGRLLGRPVTEILDGAWFDRIDGDLILARRTDPDATLAVAAADADTARAAAQLRAARAQRIPDLTFSAGARWLEATDDTAAVFGVSVPLPLFNSGHSAVVQASAERARADALRRVSTLDAADAIDQARADLANAATRARTATGPALAAAQESARIARIGYREGKFGQLDLLDAERTLGETRSAAIDALIAYHDAHARLDRLTANRADDRQGLTR